MNDPLRQVLPGTASRGFDGYTRAEMQATLALTRAENPGWRWLFPVTRVTRDFVTAQMPVMQGAYAVAVGLVFWAAQLDGVVDARLMGWWLGESVASMVVRSLLYVPVVRASPVEIAANPLLRVAPLLSVALGAAHWIWTATIFVRPELNLTTLVVALAFVMLSIACIAMAPASPAACAVYLFSLWLAMGYQLGQADWAGFGTFTVLVAALASILWMTFHTVIGGVRRYLLRSDEADLLLDALRERNVEVERLRNAAATELAARSSFFASASHDLRQRVHAMKLMADAEEGGSRTRLTAVVEDLEIYMTDVLELARLETTSLTPDLQMVRLQQVFQELEVEFEEVAASRRVDFRARATSLAVRTDHGMLLRILENLVANAIKFTRDRVLLAARLRQEGVVIEVWDRGPGIPAEQSERVFDPFFQGAEARVDPEHGVGLGLAIVKRLATALSYRIEVHSGAGRGTRMRLVIPHDDAKIEAGQAHEQC